MCGCVVVSNETWHTLLSVWAEGECSAARPGPFCAESALPVGPSWGQASDSKSVCVRVCVGRTSCCRDLYKCKEAVSVCFIRHTTDEGQVENPLHCECVRWACTKRGNKNREQEQNGEWKGKDTPASPPPLLCVFLFICPPLSLRLSVSLPPFLAVRMKCGPGGRPWREGGHKVVFSPRFSRSPLHFTFCFNANSFIIISLVLTRATWKRSNPEHAAVKSDVFTAPWLDSTWQTWTPLKKSLFHVCCSVLLQLSYRSIKVYNVPTIRRVFNKIRKRVCGIQIFIPLCKFETFLSEV